MTFTFPQIIANGDYALGEKLDPLMILYGEGEGGGERRGGEGRGGGSKREGGRGGKKP